jgi:hypothetical protein
MRRLMLFTLTGTLSCVVLWRMTLVLAPILADEQTPDDATRVTAVEAELMPEKPMLADRSQIVLAVKLFSVDAKKLQAKGITFAELLSVSDSNNDDPAAPKLAYGQANDCPRGRASD